jgi:NADH-quinone oxidoreductase subunit F
MEDLPAMLEEIEEAEFEGIKFNCLMNPTRIIGEQGKVVGLEVQQQRLGDFDQSARRRPVPVEGALSVIDVDVVIPAIGQVTESSVFADSGMEVARGNIVADKKSGTTSVAGVFSAGDCVTGPDTVIDAIAAGKRAAASMDKYLGGSGEVTERFTGVRVISGELIEHEEPRRNPPMLPKEHRCSMKEVEQLMSEEAAVAEASRCLRCDVKE